MAKKVENVAGMKRKLSKLASSYDDLSAAARRMRETNSAHSARILELEDAAKKDKRTIEDLTNAREVLIKENVRLKEGLSDAQASRERWRTSYRGLRTHFGREGVLDSLDNNTITD